MAVTQRSGESAPVSLHAHLPSPAWPSPGDATQKGNRVLERRWDLQDSLVPWPWTQASYWGSFCPSRGLPRTPAAGPVWAPPWSTSQPKSPAPHPLGQHVCPVGLLALGTLSLRGYETHAYEGHKPFAHKMGRLGCVTSGWVSSLTRVSCDLSRARTQFRHFCLVKRHLWAQVLMLVGRGPDTQPTPTPSSKSTPRPCRKSSHCGGPMWQLWLRALRPQAHCPQAKERQVLAPEGRGYR